jgi:arginase
VFGRRSKPRGTAAGARADSVVWFDAHADFDDPDENTSGFFDVMGLAMLTGRGWEGLRATIPGHEPIRESRVVLAGVRDLEDYQRQRLEASAVRSEPGRIKRERFAREIGDLAAVASRAYVHVDLDSLDASVATANEYAAAGGPSMDRLIDCIRLCCARLDVVAAAVTAYDPTLDRDDRTLGAARRVVDEIAAGVRTS